MSEQERLLEVADAVATGSDVDWEKVERLSADDQERSVVRELRLLADIAEVARNPSSKRTSSANRASADRITSWGHLRVLEQIGRGSFGVVYRAWDSKLERHVALKLVEPPGTPNTFDLSRAIREARLLARVRHQNVVSVLGADCHDDRFGLWMELINGLTLDELVKAQGTMSAREAVGIGVYLCHALAAVHRARLLHRDIKASNVMRENGGRIVLMDFGAGRRMPAPEDPVDPLAGTPLYLAPEVLAGSKPSIASDIYSLGVLLYYIVSGSYPVTGGDRQEVERAHERRQRVSLRDVRPNLTPAFVEAIERALSPEPQLRYRSAGEFGAALAATEGGRYEPDPSLWLNWKVGAAGAIVATMLLIGIAQSERLRMRFSPPAAAPAPTATTAQSYQVEATFYALRNGQSVRLTSGSRVQPGDQLYLTLETSRPVYAYVVNQDEAGEAFLLFPLTGFEPQNPLPRATTNRLPGFRDGKPDCWEVTSTGGREHFLVYVAGERLADFERMLAVLPRPSAARVAESLDPREMIRMRGVGGITPSRESTTAPALPGIAELKPLPDGRETTTGIWARRITFDNPR